MLVSFMSRVLYVFLRFVLWMDVCYFVILSVVWWLDNLVVFDSSSRLMFVIWLLRLLIFLFWLWRLWMYDVWFVFNLRIFVFLFFSDDLSNFKEFVVVCFWFFIDVCADLNVLVLECFNFWSVVLLLEICCCSCVMIVFDLMMCVLCVCWVVEWLVLSFFDVFWRVAIFLRNLSINAAFCSLSWFCNFFFDLSCIWDLILFFCNFFMVFKYLSMCVLSVKFCICEVKCANVNSVFRSINVRLTFGIFWLEL